MYKTSEENVQFKLGQLRSRQVTVLVVLLLLIEKMKKSLQIKISKYGHDQNHSHTTYTIIGTDTNCTEKSDFPKF